MEANDQRLKKTAEMNNINHAQQELAKLNELDEYRHVYQDLFDHVPCFITVQDNHYRLLRYNREFYDAFDPKPGDFCFRAYKGRNEKCTICPVEKTFMDGCSHLSEESGPNKHGTMLHWVVKTSPIQNARGDIVAVMEMCLDITYKKKLEEELEVSEKKYRAIFNNIPNPLFVLDADTLTILDCNGSVNAVYSYTAEEIIDKPFHIFFKDEEKGKYASMLKRSSIINSARHITKDNKEIFVNIRISPSEHLDKRSFLVTTSDITQQLEIEHQLIQTSKMATLGEMATGVAHELNQPLSVIKTASHFFLRKVYRKENIDGGTILNLANKIVNNVDRATKIINHMREFGRKSDLNLEHVQVNDILQRAYDALGQQLKLRGIEVVWELHKNVPLIKVDPVRLEQVIINLLLNARDAIEEKLECASDETSNEKITLKTKYKEDEIIIEIHDTGAGIPTAAKDKIFEPFYTTKKVGKGTGLGLSISYGIIKDCGGTIQAMPRNEGGSCFIIRIPVRKNEEGNI